MSGIWQDENAVTLGSDLVADTTAETLSAVADGAGFDQTTFLVKLGDVDAAAVLTFAVKENTASSTSSPTPTAVALDRISSSVSGVITSGNVVLTESSGNLDGKIVLITVTHSGASKRYLFLSITATVESYEVGFIGIIQSRSRTVPVTQSSDVVASASLAK